MWYLFKMTTLLVFFNFTGWSNWPREKECGGRTCRWPANCSAWKDSRWWPANCSSGRENEMYNAYNYITIIAHPRFFLYLSGKKVVQCGKCRGCLIPDCVKCGNCRDEKNLADQVKRPHQEAFLSMFTGDRLGNVSSNNVFPDTNLLLLHWQQKEAHRFGTTLSF